MIFRSLLPMPLLFCLVACGGRLSLMTLVENPEPVHDPFRAPTPPPPTPPNIALFAEDFRYQKPSGTLVLPVLFFSSKTMQTWALRLSQARENMAEQLCHEESGFEKIHLLLSSDSAEAEVYSIALNPRDPGCFSSASQWFGRQLEQLERDLQKDFSTKRFPFRKLGEILSKLSVTGFTSHSPAWVHALYVRDHELLEAPAELDAPGRANFFKKALERIPLSPWRQSVSFFSYLSAETPCEPLKSRLAPGLRRYLSAVPGQAEELCNFGDRTLSRWLSFVADQSRRLVLGRKPRRETLKVLVAGKELPKQFFVFDENSQEITLDERTGAKRDDLIEVKYEAL